MALRWPAIDAVVIGASAGGLEALMTLLAGLPANFPAAVLIVLHRPPVPVPGSSPATILARRCALPVDEAWDHQPIEPGRVLVAPADYHLLVDPGPVTALSCDEPVLWSRPAIDPLFESASHVWHERVLAIVLTGASADGTAGATRVRAAGGELWVQDPAEAVASTMPSSALRTAGADRVLRLQQMSETLGAGLAAARAPGDPA